MTLQMAGISGSYVLPDGNRVARLRAAKRWSRLTLATRADLSEGAIAWVERGNRTKYTTLCQIAEAFGVNVRELLPRVNGGVKVVIEFVIKDGRYETDEDAWHDLVKQIRSICGNAFNLLRIWRGSIRISVEVSLDDAPPITRRRRARRARTVRGRTRTT